MEPKQYVTNLGKLEIREDGFVYYQEDGKEPVRLPFRFLPDDVGRVEFAVRDKVQRWQYGRRVTVDLSALVALELERCKIVDEPVANA